MIRRILASPYRIRGYRYYGSRKPRILLETPEMVIYSKPVNDFAMNQYVIGCKKTHAAALVDVGDVDSELWFETISSLKMKLDHVLLTHGHIDHIMGLRPTKRKFPQAKVHLHSGDQRMLEMSLSQDTFYLNLMRSQGGGGGDEGHDSPANSEIPPVEKCVDQELKDGESINVGELTFLVFHTPGHCLGHCVFYNQQNSVLFSGDLLFRRSIGRTDLPGSSSPSMITSLHKIMTLPDETRVFPGHMESTFIGYERGANPFLRQLGYKANPKK